MCSPSGSPSRLPPLGCCFIKAGGVMLKMKLHCLGYLMLMGTNLLEETLRLGKIEARRRRGRQRMKWLDGIINSTDMSLSRLREMVKERRTWRAAVHGVAKSQTLSNSNKKADWERPLQTLINNKAHCYCQLLSRVRPRDPMDCNSPGSAVHGVFQARILKLQ